MEPEAWKEDLKDRALEWGADFFGVADLEAFRGTPTEPADLLTPYVRAISMGVALSRGIFENLSDGPTPHYSHHYTKANELLDQVALRVAKYIQRRGRRAIPVPASQVLNREDWTAAISHKAVARMAGLGWQGKSLLLVNPDVGPRIRLVTVLTDIELPADAPLANGCGRCLECTNACPAGAILGRPFGEGYAERSEAWKAEACTGWIEEHFMNRPGVTSWICGLCIKACPIGRVSRPYRSAPAIG